MAMAVAQVRLPEGLMDEINSLVGKGLYITMLYCGRFTLPAIRASRELKYDKRLHCTDQFIDILCYF